MNIITFNRAYCLYPRATLEERLSLVCTDRNDDVIERVYERYRKRGWTVLRTLGEVASRTRDPALGSVVRWVEDGFTWTISLPFQPQQEHVTTNPHADVLTRDPISVSSWRMVVGEDHDHGWMYFDNVSVPMALTPEVLYLLDIVKEASTDPAWEKRC